MSQPIHIGTTQGGDTVTITTDPDGTRAVHVEIGDWAFDLADSDITLATSLLTSVGHSELAVLIGRAAIQLT